MVSQKKKIMDNMETYPVFYIVFCNPEPLPVIKGKEKVGCIVFSCLLDTCVVCTLACEASSINSIAVVNLLFEML